MKTIIRVISAVLVICSVLFLTGCKEDSDTVSSTHKKGNTPNESESGLIMNSDGINIVFNKESNYTIVYSSGEKKAKESAEFLASSLLSATGVKLNVASDKSKAAEFEILIGNTNREESAELSTDIEKNQYRIKMINQKLCIVADSFVMLHNAVTDFLKETVDFNSVCDYSTNKDCVLSKNYTLSKTRTDPIPSNPIYKKGDFNDGALVGLFDRNKKVFARDLKENLAPQTQMHFTDFLTVGDEIWCYYIQPLGNGASGVGLAVSTDGIKFEKRANVLVPSKSGWDSRFASFPGIWYDNGVYYLAYEGAGGADSPGAVGLATSTDGINFEKKGKILDATGKGIYSVNVGTPDLFKKDGTWYLSYHTYDGKTCQLCVAIGKDLMNLTHHKANPVIPTSENGPDSGTTGRRDVIFYDGWFYMTYEISTRPPYDSAKWSHTFARSKDFINWETVEQIIPSTNKGFGNDGPSFLIRDGEVWVYYRTGLTSCYRLSLD